MLLLILSTTNHHRPTRCPTVCDDAPAHEEPVTLTQYTERRTRWPARSKPRRRSKNPKPSGRCTSAVHHTRPHSASNEELTCPSPQVSSALFFQANTALGPPYSVLVDTNFLSHTVHAKLELDKALMDLLYAKATPIITTCVMAELEKLGPKYRIALRIARDERWERLKCDHKGTYADDCIVERVMKHRIYLVATNDRDLKRRIRKIPGVPIVSVAKGKYVIERLPDAPDSR